MNIRPTSSCYLLQSGHTLTREECDLLRENLEEDPEAKSNDDVMSFMQQMSKEVLELPKMDSLMSNKLPDE